MCDISSGSSLVVGSGVAECASGIGWIGGDLEVVIDLMYVW